MGISFKPILIAGVILFSSAFLFAGGNKEVPEIPPVTSGTQYISPNGDGVQEEATLEFSVRLFVKSKEGYVPEYGLKLLDPAGKVVAQEIQTEKRDIGWFASIFRGYDEFELKKTITWDGKDENDQVVSDGTYKVQVWVKDASGNESFIDVDDFVVDTLAPEVTVNLPGGMLFAPNGDQILDTLKVEQTGGTQEDLWEGRFLDSAGKEVYSLSWESGAPAGFEWDGKDARGAQVSDGTYSYEISAEDRAGNSFSKTVPGIILDSRAPMVRGVIDNPAFSPNHDGEKDTATVVLEYDETGDVENWSWSLASGGEVFLQQTGKDPLPDQVVLDGKDEAGEPLPQGNYTFSFSVAYTNGWRPVVEFPVSLDSTPARISVSASSPVFSPNGDGLNDKTNISFKSSEPVIWTGGILNMEGEPVLQTSSAQTTSLVVWDGTNLNGETLPDGQYLVLGTFTDRAGNVSYSEPLTIKVDNRSVGLSVSAPAGFSPNGNGIEDTIDFTVRADLRDEVTRWTLAVTDQAGEQVRLFSGTGTLPESVSWDGTRALMDQTDEQIIVPEGPYTARLTVDYEKGDVAAAATAPFFVDVTPPEIRLLVSSDPFIKTDTGVEGNVFMSVLVENNSEITDWNLEIRDDRGNILRSYTGEGDPSGDVAWNSVSDPGLLSGDPENFTITLDVTDAGGNRSSIDERLPLDILLVRRNGKLFLMVPNIIFGAYQDSLASAGPRMEQQNRDSLKKVVNIYERYPQYDLGLEAHALNIYLGGPREAQEEKILFPLTERRGETVKNALIDLGMDGDHIQTRAYGGQFPIADVTDRSVWWKNRRVEFIMVEE